MIAKLRYLERLDGAEWVRVSEEERLRARSLERKAAIDIWDEYQKYKKCALCDETWWFFGKYYRNHFLISHHMKSVYVVFFCRMYRCLFAKTSRTDTRRDCCTSTTSRRGLCTCIRMDRLKCPRRCGSLSRQSPSDTTTVNTLLNTTTARMTRYMIP